MTYWITLASIYVLGPGLRLWGGHVFRSDRSCQNRGPKGKSVGVGEDEMKLEPNDVNL